MSIHRPYAMKKMLITLLLLISVLSARGQAAQRAYEALEPADRELIESAIGLVDSGMAEAALEDFDYLYKKYPDNYLVLYERMYTLYELKRYHAVIMDRDKLLDREDATELCYQIVGNAYDMYGDPKNAARTYRAGLERFPDSGSLYLELGNLSLHAQDYAEAIKLYNEGIGVEPNFASNYYRAAQLYLDSEAQKVWGLIYAETAVLLAPNNTDRHYEMAQGIVDCYRRNIAYKDSTRLALEVDLVPATDITIDPDTKQVFMAFPGVYEMLVLLSAGTALLKAELTWSIPQLIQMRKKLVEFYYSLTGAMYGPAMYLLEFQKQVIDAGHWDAYNYFLFMNTDPESLEAWFNEHEDDFTAFISWYNDNAFFLGDTGEDGIIRSVDPASIYRYYEPQTLESWLKLQNSLRPTD